MESKFRLSKEGLKCMSLVQYGGLCSLAQECGGQRVEGQKERSEILKRKIFKEIEPSTSHLTSQKEVSLSVI